MKRNNILMLAFIIIMGLCAIVKQYWDYPAWPLVVEAITVASWIFAVADFLVIHSAAQEKITDTLQPSVEWMLEEMSRIKKAVDVRIYQLNQKTAQQKKPTEPTICYTDQDDLEYHMDTKKNVSVTEAAAVSLNQLLEKGEKRAKVFSKLGYGLTVLGFVAFFGIVIFGSIAECLGLSLDLMTIWAFIIILFTQYYDTILDEAREKMKIKCEANLKAVEALRKSFESEVKHHAD